MGSIHVVLTSGMDENTEEGHHPCSQDAEAGVQCEVPCSGGHKKTPGSMFEWFQRKEK